MHSAVVIKGSRIMVCDKTSNFSEPSAEEGKEGDSSPKRQKVEGEAGVNPPYPEVMLHFECSTVDEANAAFKKAVDAGAKVELDIADTFWGMRYGIVRDPFGQRWSIGTQLPKKEDKKEESA